MTFDVISLCATQSVPTILTLPRNNTTILLIEKIMKTTKGTSPNILRKSHYHKTTKDYNRKIKLTPEDYQYINDFIRSTTKAEGEHSPAAAYNTSPYLY